MNGFLDLAYAAKAWVGMLVAAVTQVVAGVQLAVADEAISFDEAQGVWLLVTEAVGVLALGVSIFNKRNAPAPVG